MTGFDTPTLVAGAYSLPPEGAVGALGRPGGTSVAPTLVAGAGVLSSTEAGEVRAVQDASAGTLKPYASELQERQRVVEQALLWLGTPYHHQGRVCGVGVDCATLLCEVYHAAGLIPYIDPRPYPPDWHLHRDAERYLAWVEQYAVSTVIPQLGDIALWRFGRCFSHAAIVLEGTQVIHAYLRQGCVLADRAHEPLKHRAVKFFTLWPRAAAQSDTEREQG